MTALETAIEVPFFAKTAADLMRESPVSIRADASVYDALVLFAGKGFSAAPVIDAAGRAIGVVSLSDLIVHDRANVEWYLTHGASSVPATEPAPEKATSVTVRELMTPAVFAVPRDTAAAKVIEQMLALNVHRLFVVDSDGILVGVITALDVLRHLHTGEERPPHELEG